MNYAQAAAIILFSAGAVLALSYVVHRRVPVRIRNSHHEVGAAIFLQLGVLFAVLLAFVFNEAYSEYGEAQRAIDLECGAMHASAILSATLPRAEAQDLLGLQATYLHDVVSLEWPELGAHRRPDNAARSTLTVLMQHAARLPVTDPSVGPLKSQLLALLAEAHAQREIRLYQATNGLPVPLWVVLIGFDVVLTAFVAFSGLLNYLSLALFSMLFSTFASATLVLVRLLDYPFEGAIGLSPRSFVETMQKVLDLLHTV